MHQVHTKTGREQRGYSPQLPPRYGIEETTEGSEDENEDESIHFGRVRGWTPKHDGPEGSATGIFIVAGVLVVWAIWIVLGFIWLFRTGDFTPLKMSPIA